MKRLSLHSTSCSCTSCVYRSRSKQASVQQLLADGSKIDKLYYGKYLPLRERKLLEKLIRTRAVYDDVRNQLISSGSSDRRRSVQKLKRREDDSTEKSSAVLKMVDLVDRGHIGTSNTSKLNSCCSCCSCKSLRKIKKQMEKHPRVYRHNVPYEAIARYTVEAEKKGRRHRQRLSAKISSKIRAVHFKMKSIRSEPCTCTLSLNSLLTRPSKHFMRKIRAKELAAKEAETQKTVNVERKSLKKKLCSCPCKIAKLPMKSIRKFRNIGASMKKEPGTDIKPSRFKIRKDSLTLFKEKMFRKLAAKDWECESGICVVDECIPEQCLKKKTKGIGARRSAYSRHSGSGRERQSRVSISTRSKRVRVIGSRVQTKHRYSNKSESSMTNIFKPKSLTKITSVTAELQAKRIQFPKPRGILKQTTIQERTHKIYPPKRTDSYVHRDKKQGLPASKLNKLATKSSSSMTTILRRRTLYSVSKSEIKLKQPSPKPRPLTSVPKVSKARVAKPKLLLEEKAMKKSHDKDKEQITSKSTLGHALCECQPSTKSFSTMTTISKLKVLSTDGELKEKGLNKTGRHRQRKDKNLYTREKKPVKYPRNSSSKSLFSITLSKPKLQMKDTIKSPKRPKQGKNVILIRHKPRQKKLASNEGKEPESGKKPAKSSSSQKFAIELSKTRKPLLPILSQHKKSGSSKSSQDSKISYLHESISQAFKPHRGSVLPFPRECEPSMCIPYECDPENCARILLSQSKPQRRSVTSSTDHLKLKSVGSTAFSQKTSPKSKYIVSKSTETFTGKVKGVSKHPPPQSVERNVRAENSHPQRQAVRISSNLSFDIEFYKDKSPSWKADGTQVLLPKSRKKNKHTDYRRKYRERGTSDSHSRHNTSSQSRSSQSLKKIQVGHKLKRCFCTLRLSQTKTPKFTNLVSRKTMASFRIKGSDNTASKKQTQTISSGIKYRLTPATSHRSLLPYECEPYFCTPGECNPYDCAERIKERNRKEALRFSKDTNTMVAKKKSISTFASQPSTKSFSKGIPYKMNKPKKIKSRYSYSSKEESKVSSGKIAKQGVRIGSSFTFDIELSKKKDIQPNLHEQETVKGMKKEKIPLQNKGIHIHHERSGKNKNVKTKQTYTEHFLRKCFCTLGLLKKSKKKEETARLHNEYVYVHKTFTTNRADIRYNYERSKILPFEYKFTPDEREINFQNKCSNTANLATQPTLRNVTQTMNSSKTQYTPSKARNKMNIVSSQSKQKALRVGSTYSFSIDSLKEKSPQNSKNRKKATKDKNQAYDDKRTRLETIGSEEFAQIQHVATDIEQKPKKKGNSLATAIKKCFCAFKFPSNSSAKQQNKNNLNYGHTKTSHPLSNPLIEFKGSRKNYQCQLPNPHIYEPLHYLKSDELARHFCVPKMLDSYNCYEEELKRPEIKRSCDRYVNTEKQRKSFMRTTSSFNGSSKSKSNQSRLLQRTSTKEKKMREPQKDTGPSSYLSPSRDAYFVRSIHNIENSIRADKHKSVSKTSTANKMKSTNDKQIALRNSFTQSEKVRKEGKASNIGYLLKRCFCTLGLQKKNATAKTQLLKFDIQKNLPLTSQFVHILPSNENSNVNNVTKINCSALDERYGGIPLELKLPNDPLKDYIFGHQTGKTNMFKNSTSFEKRLKSGVNLNFNEYQVGYFINTRKLSPFYQSFYALNLNVPNNIPKRGYVLEDNECEPGFCIPYQCDPVECLKRINSRLKTSKLSGTNRQESKSVEFNGKYKDLKNKIVTPRRRKSHFGKYQGSPTIIGSNVSVNMGVYKYTNPQLSNKQMLGTSLHPIMEKNKQYSRHGIRMRSDVRVAMSLYKQKKQRNDGTTSSSRPKHCRAIASQCTQRQLKHSEAQISYQGISKGTGISHFLSRCFCTTKLKNESQRIPEKRKKGGKDKTKNAPENKKTEPKKLKKNKKNAMSEKSQTGQQKYKKICKGFECGGISINKPCRHSIGPLYPKFKSTASLRSRKNIKSRSFQSKGKDWSSPSNCCVQKQLHYGDNSLRQSRNVTFGSNIHFGMEFYKDRSQGKGDQVQYGPKADIFKFKNPKTKTLKGENSPTGQGYYGSLLHPYQCEINTCIPSKCSPVQFEKLINKRRLRSKNTKVNNDRNAPSAPSVFTDTELGIIQPYMSKTSKTGKYTTSSSTQNYEDKSILTNRQNKSVLKCFCVLTQRTCNPTCQVLQQEKCTNTKCKKANLNNFVDKCLCTLKHLKGNKHLALKPSTQQIATIPMKTGIKFEKKVKTQQTSTLDREMETIMPYSKKKFKKLESKTKLKQEAIMNQRGGIGDRNSPKVVQFCPVCKNLTTQQSSKQSRNTCRCSRKNCLCFEGEGERRGKERGEGGGDQDQTLCPVCFPKASGKHNKKAKKYKGTLQDEEQCPKSECPCCKRVLSLETITKLPQNVKKCVKNKICSFFTCNNKEIKNIDSDPLFELLVNKHNMNILNRDEVLKNLGSSGKESKAMKKARKAIEKGEISSPLMKMIIDKQSARIINRDDIINQINKQKRGKAKEQAKIAALLGLDTYPQSERKISAMTHGSKCKCCVCAKNRKKNIKKGTAKPKPKARKLKPCICGSVICKRNWQKLKREERSIKSLKIKPCVCGSDICKQEAQKMPEVLLQAARRAQEDKERVEQATIKEKKYQKGRGERKKLHAKEDKKLLKKRKKEDKREMKLVKNYENPSSVLMVAESLVDLGSLGAKVFCDVMKSAVRVAKHPRDGVYHIKDAVRDPSRAAKKFRKSLKGMGLFSTFARIKRRLIKMPVTKGAISKLESVPVTNYLVHMADKDPKQRVNKFKKKRYREPVDFQCSLFMATLKKKPCLKIYYMCPWFYPHCLGLLKIWQQFIDIVIFALAVVVWSPCILTMEVLRYLMCFLFCSA
nr:uncharacterized protein LOC110375026 [Helicoverpa armigera]